MLILSSQISLWRRKDVKMQDYETEATFLHKRLLLNMFILYLKCLSTDWFALLAFCNHTWQYQFKPVASKCFSLMISSSAYCPPRKKTNQASAWLCSSSTYALQWCSTLKSFEVWLNGLTLVCIFIEQTFNNVLSVFSPVLGFSPSLIFGVSGRPHIA